MARQESALEQQREHAGVAIEPVVADFPVGEESGKGHIPKGLADQPQLLRLPAEEVPSARDAGKVERSPRRSAGRSEEHTSELQSLMCISYAVFCLKKKTYTN